MSRPEIDADLAVIDAALRGEGDGSELATLVADVRASAPRMSPALERRLEAIATRPARVRGGRRWWRLAPAGGVAIVVAGVIAAVVVNSDTDMTVSRENSRPLATQPDQTQAEPMGASGAHILRQPAPAAGVQSQSVGPRRRVDNHDSLTLAVPRADFAGVTDDVIRTADRFDGIVQRSSVDQEGRDSIASFDLRIPTSRLDDALAALSRLAHVRARSAGTEDVTGAYNAAVGRLADARAERRALLRALAKATTDAQVLSLRARLREVRERIDRARRAVDALRRQTDLARVEVSVVTTRGSEAAPPGDGHWTPRDALRDAGRVLEVAAGVMVVGLAALAPVALLTALALLGARVARRRRREAALG